MVGRACKTLSHFHRISTYTVQCKHCDKTLSSKHTSSNLTRHLIRTHKALARTIFAGDEGRMLAELKEELEAAEDKYMPMDATNVSEGETMNAIRAITEDESPEPESRNKIIGKNNKLWAHFYRMSEFMAKCKHCNKTLSSKHTSSNLMRHLLRRHRHLSKQLLMGPNLLSPKKEKVVISIEGDQTDPLEKVDFDDVDSIIEKVNDHLEDEEPFYEYVVDNTEEVDPSKTDIDPQTGEHSIDQIGDSGSYMEATTQLDEKLKAETIYFNEMAELARAKRRLIDLQIKKLLLEMNVVETH